MGIVWLLAGVMLLWEDCFVFSPSDVTLGGLFWFLAGVVSLWGDKLGDSDTHDMNDTYQKDK